MGTHRKTPLPKVERCAVAKCRRSLLTDRERAWGMCGVCIAPHRNAEMARHARFNAACFEFELGAPK